MLERATTRPTATVCSLGKPTCSHTGTTNFDFMSLVLSMRNLEELNDGGFSGAHRAPFEDADPARNMHERFPGKFDDGRNLTIRTPAFACREWEL